MKSADVAIVGAGIVGLATALETLRCYPGARVLVLEKEPGPAAHQTGHNSGVIHSGIYYRPGSLKARYSVEGAARMVKFCSEQDVPYRICGKVIVAVRPEQVPQLEELYRRGLANGVPGVRMLDAAGLHEIEPNAAGVRAIHVPGTGITDYKQVAQRYAEMIARSGGEVRYGEKIRGVRQTSDQVVLSTDGGEYGAAYVVNCAGLHSDRIARSAGAQVKDRIIPFRGEYYTLEPSRHDLIRGLIYPVPDPRFPFLGVHFTLRITGEVEAGPNAVLAFSREGYSKGRINARDLAELTAFPGFWRMARKYWRTGSAEIYRSFSKRAFVAALQELVPAIQSNDLRDGGSGVRAQLVEPSGSLVDDFRLIHDRRITHVCNVPSPAATASLAIAANIVAEFAARAELKLGQTVQSSS